MNGLTLVEWCNYYCERAFINCVMCKWHGGLCEKVCVCVLCLISEVNLVAKVNM